jgi:hypothetical protein
MITPSPAAIEAAAKFYEFLNQHGVAKTIRERKGFRTTAEVFAQFEEDIKAPLLERNAWLAETAGLATDRGMSLERDNDRLKHEAWRHIDSLLLYAAGDYPNDSAVKEAVEFCRQIDPKRRLRMEGQLHREVNQDALKQAQHIIDHGGGS